jgi:uncharacterized membrane protein
MMNTTNAVLAAAAIAGLLAAAHAEGSDKKDSGKPADLPKCYGVNSCSGKSKCAAKGHSCAGKNACAGQGWLPMPAESCVNITNGSLKPIEAPIPDDKLPGAPLPSDNKQSRY